MEPAYVTKEDLRQALAESEERIERRVEQQLANLREELVNELTEKIRDAQTEILRGFHNWVRPLEARVRHIDEHAQRLSWVEDRVSEIERRLDLGGKK
jgi:vacuolar-type H+-ATPase subunit E/Vma4